MVVACELVVHKKQLFELDHQIYRISLNDFTWEPIEKLLFTLALSKPLRAAGRNYQVLVESNFPPRHVEAPTPPHGTYR